jgi:putative CocE/NonD family hydrolase
MTEAMVPMRDGAKLHTVVFAPKPAGAPLPFLFVRTPYGVPGSARTLGGDAYRELAAEGYIFVFQDIRGRYKSEGQFVMMRPPRDRRDAKAVDESTDAADTVAWLLANVPGHNGRAGLKGVSYGGWLTAMAMIEPHPAVRAVSPQAPPADMYLGDDFHHNGAFRLSYGFEYATRMETTKEQTNFDRYDTYSGTSGWTARGPAESTCAAGSDLERLRGPPGLRRLLAAAGHGPLPDAGNGADADRGRLVGPGGPLRPAEAL